MILKTEGEICFLFLLILNFNKRSFVKYCYNNKKKHNIEWKEDSV